MSLCKIRCAVVVTYRKFSIKPTGGLIDFKHSIGGLNGEGGLIREGG